METLSLVSLATAVLFGGLSFISPCVLPLLPGYLSLMSGYSVAELQSGEGSVRRMLVVTSLFVAGFTAVFVALGATATSLGRFVLANLTTGTRIAGWIVVVFGLVIFFSALTNASWLQNLMRERRMDVRPSRFGKFAPPVMGVAFGFGWTPCIGPVLGGILALAGTQETVGQGIVLLLAYSAGLGVPFILAGVGMTRAFKTMTFFRKHLRTINVFSGALLAGFGVLMITNRLFIVSGWVTEVLERIPGLERLAAI